MTYEIGMALQYTWLKYPLSKKSRKLIADTNIPEEMTEINGL